MKSFEEASQFLETFLSSFGIGTCVDGDILPASGELLFQAYQSFHEIEEAINAKEPEIIKQLGDRREKFESDRTSPMVKLPGQRYLLNIDCIGRTSHSCGVLVMLNLINDAIPVSDPARSISQCATWKTLTNSERGRIAQCEQSFSTWGGAHMLADGVQFERIAIRKSPQSDAQWTPEAEAEARRLIDAKIVKSATALQERLSINRQVSQELFRHITGKQKKKYHRE